MDASQAVVGFRIPSIVDIIVFSIRATTVLFVALLVIKTLYFIINKKVVRSHKTNVRIALVPVSLILFWLGYMIALSSFITIPELFLHIVTSLLSFGIPLLFIFALSFFLLEIIDFVLFLKRKIRVLTIVLLTFFIFFLYPRKSYYRQPLNDAFDKVTTCKCAGVPAMGDYCFGLTHSCLTDQKPAEIHFID